MNLKCNAFGLYIVRSQKRKMEVRDVIIGHHDDAIASLVLHFVKKLTNKNIAPLDKKVNLTYLWLQMKCLEHP